MIQFVKMIFQEKKKIAISLYIMNYRTLYKKGTGIVSKSVTVCKNEHSPLENTFAQSVIRVSFGHNQSTPTQAHLPWTTARA